MAVDLGDLVDNLKREVSPPGQSIFPDATDDDWLGYLQDAFWEARLDGITVLAQWGELDGAITPITVGNADITLDLLQMLVLFAGIRILRNQIINQTNTRYKAGPVEADTMAQAPTVLTTVLQDLRNKRDIILLRLSDVGSTPAYVIDAIRGRDMSIGWGDTDWVGY